MPARFVNIDHDTPLLLPPDLRDWVPPDHLVHFIMDAVGLLDLSAARVNHSGSGSEQYPPSLMLGLLIYSYATGTFSSRKIEKNTREQVAVRLLCADRHPDHDRGGGGESRGLVMGEPASALFAGKIARCSRAASIRCWRARRASPCSCSPARRPPYSPPPPRWTM